MLHKVTVQPSGHQFDVEAGESILDAAMRQNIELPYGCRGGVCGSCTGYIIEGEVYYDDQPIALDENMKANGQALFCIAKTHADLQISIEELDDCSPLEIRKMGCHVSSKNHLCHDVIALQITLDHDQRLQYHAGQYIEFILEDGKRRAFSIANAPHKDDLIELHIRHIDGGIFTDFLFKSMPEHSALQIEGPLGQFYLREDRNRPLILMGGGTGFGPLKAMIEHIEHVGFNQPVHLFMGVRALRDLYMSDMIEQWIAKNNKLSFTPVLSDPQNEDNWPGETGFVHQVVAQQFPHLSEFDIYMSGPPPMVNAAVELFTAQGASKDNMYSDAFEYSSDANQAIAANKKP
ncbi:2-polyprenylphenol hydroxylase and related flavodoxin oxidoreductases / CDP-6-deoxy-delta-3,4-glucoseen reductase-like [hydrothermal vent metagenome]|uniref:2-polyprenylphenol hydroxylase and related flavodoxin oxidoreductases / CDP-6-deoxy-delta-3,4-glucoseen reductase-like n=1 Tax=hydrothermal vent metagenome TaxID=652676 RepID=A0A3B0XIN5_9ZZZZ